jgi:hypothetical protein
MADVQCREDSIAGASFLPDKKEQWGLGKERKGKERLAAADELHGVGIARAGVLAHGRACRQMSAHVHVGARVCMPKGDPRRRAPGGTEKATTRPCALSTKDSMVKGGALVGFLDAARTTVKHQSGGAAFRLPACSHRRISAPGCARVRLRTPKGDALPPSVCACASPRFDLGGELGDSASKHMTAPQPGERTMARY